LLLFEDIAGGEKRETPCVVDSISLNLGSLPAQQAAGLAYDSELPATGQEKEAYNWRPGFTQVGGGLHQS